MAEFKPFSICTCEALLDEEHRSRNYAPRQGAPFAPFEIYDPFGLRNAIVPVFQQYSDGRMYGMGTAFHVDGFGSFFTAHHVIDFVENHPDSRPLLLLGMNAVLFGEVSIPPDCFVPAAGIFASMVEADDPMAELLGKSVRVPAIDVASLKVSEIGPGVSAPQTLLVRAKGWIPHHEEIVLAIGFPDLDLSEVDEETQRALLAEGMYGAYGKVIEVHPNGTSSSNRTPVFVVESDWPSGMSGGPIFNRKGEVVGMVSRSLRPELEMPGRGYATYFGLTQDLELLSPTLDITNPGWRLCWAIFSDDIYTPISMHESQKAAEMVAHSLNQPSVIKKISNRIGTQECVVQAP